MHLFLCYTPFFKKPLHSKHGTNLETVEDVETETSETLENDLDIDKLLSVKLEPWNKVERKIKDLSPEDRYEKRLEESKPIIDEFSDWLKITKRTSASG
jgi:hypothetical protein